MSDDGNNHKAEKLDALKERLEVFDQYLADDTINEIAVNDLREIWVRRGHKWECEPNKEITYERLEKVGKAVANYTGNQFNRMNTSLSGYFPTGERIEMTHPPQAPEGMIYLNLRKHTDKAYPHSELIEQGYYKYVRHEYSINMTAERRKQLYEYLTPVEKQLWDLISSGKFVEFVEMCIKQYQNIVASGRTGSGKTAYLRSLVEMVPPSDRLITIEDTPEMPTKDSHKNSQNLFYKKHGEDKEGATAEGVLHSVMRKTPTRVFLTELRGEEALFYLVTVLSSGHPGGLTSAHGNSPRDLFFRLALLIVSSESGNSLDMKTVLNLLHMTINVVIQLDFNEEKGRHITGIYYDPMYRLELVG